MLLRVVSAELELLELKRVDGLQFSFFSQVLLIDGKPLAQTKAILRRSQVEG